MKKIRILQTPVRFYPYIGGGVENHVLYLSKEIVKLGHSVKVICANDPPSEKTNIFGIKVKRLKKWFKITNTNITPTLPFEILRSKYDIVHTHMPTPWTSDWSILLSKITGKKSVITIHNDLNKDGFFEKLLTNFYLYTVFKFSLKLVDKIIIVNPEWEKNFVNIKNILLTHKKKISTMPNGVDTEIFKSNYLEKEKNSLLFVSILDKSHTFKGLDFLLQSIKILKDKIPSIKLTVIGEGELKNKYIKLTKELDISNNVEFLGEKNQEQLIPYYSKALVFVLPSIELEGFGIVLIEALACKTPVVTTDIVGIAKEVKQNNCGIVVKPKNSQNIADAIYKIIINNKLAKNMGENGRKMVLDKFDWKKIAERILDIYEELLK